ncbi:phage tail protein [Bacillus thuringiensis]|uniref:distal tail protein Dit n=1 Tax=Bacillus thuringiensis TaxID=1428 RepID=UPI000BF8F8C9|nr:distal tail protein Dit [Bacillus thuringiensis]PEZ18743.1 phage tail protein [Bacillus thuringiensis]PGY38572.1 phage tail protein [Bacillus thuringiensis]
MGKISFTFNQIRKDYLQVLVGRKRPAWAPIKRNLVRAPHRPGAFFMHTETEERRIDVPIVMKAKKDIAELQKLKEDVAGWLLTEEPKELIFDDEPDRTYLAMVDGALDLDELVNRGKGVITFICPMPYKLGREKTTTFQKDRNGLIATVIHNGTVESHPIIEVEVENPSTFLDVWNGEAYFRIGYPLKADQVPVERNQRVMWDEMSTTVGWTDVAKSEDMVGGGAFQSDGYRFIPAYLGEPSTKGWHGCIAKKNIPQGPLQDFIMQAYVGVRSWHWDQMGRVEIGLLDENGDYVARISMNDVHWQAEKNTGFAKIGNDKKPGNQVLINESGDYPNTWNQYRGRLWLARTGNRWEAYISRFKDGTEIDDSERFVVWIDENNVNKSKVAQVQISICQFSNNMFCQDMSIDDLKIWKVNMHTQGNLPYIADKGDKIVVDTERRSVTIEGKSASHIKDFFSRFPVIQRGTNQLEIMPPNIGKAKVTYRERYR